MNSGSRSWPARVSLVLVALLPACDSGARSEPPGDPPRVFVHATEVRRVGSVLGSDGDGFGRISGIGLHPAGGVVATDDQSSDVMFLSPEGRVLWTINGRAQGPGHFGRPCCISFDPGGGIWIYGDKRFTGFVSAPQSGWFLVHVRAGGDTAMYSAPSPVEAQGRKEYPEGRLAWTISRDAKAPELSVAQRDSAREQLDHQLQSARRAGYDIDSFEYPVMNQLLQAIWFDGSGRLWIQRTGPVERGVERPETEADVYSSSGGYLFTAVWPRNISLRHGAIRGATAWGVGRGKFGIHQLVELSLGEAGAATRLHDITAPLDSR